MAKSGTLVHEIEQFKTVIYDLPGCVYWKNKKGNYLGCNKNFLEMAGLDSVEELIGKTDHQLCWASQAHKLLKHDEKVMSKGSMSFEETVALANGETLTFTVVKSPLHDEKGKVIGVIGTSLDISQQKKFVKELEIAKEKAEVANQLKTEFMENMQHDMRTPVAGVCGILDMLQQTKNYTEISDLIPIAIKSTKELLALCNEVIEFENIEYGQHPIISKQINIRDIALHVINLNSSASRYKHIELLLEIDDALPDIVNGDGYRLKKILINLIGNSVKFTKEGKVKLAIYPVSVDQNEIRIRFEVSDTGIGIPENKKEIIFEKFTRLNPSNRGIYKGSGLGLSHVKKFVSELNGNVEVKSKLGMGTTFYITLPFKMDALPKTIYQTKRITRYQVSDSSIETARKLKNTTLPLPSLQATYPLTEKQNYQVLLIEDDMLACIIAKNLLEKLGCHITTAGDVSTAKKMLDSIKFNLVVSDIGLPDGTGFEIITCIKENKSSINYLTPFVALTAHSDEEKKLQAKKCGFLSMLQKPLTAEIATNLVNTYLLNINEDSAFPDTSKQDQYVIINLQATMDLMSSDKETALEMLELLSHSIQEEKLLLQTAYQQNDIINTRKLLHKLKGGLSYCSAPKLQKAVEELHEEVRTAEQLSSIEHLYNSFYKEIDNFIKELIKIKQ